MVDERARAAAFGKLSRPQIGRVFDRVRLFGRLDDLDTGPALWISGPAGAGKTTLAATWLRSKPDTPVLWLRLESDDANVATCATQLDMLWRDVAATDAAWVPLGRDDVADPSGWLRRRLRFLLPRLPAAWRLVLDNVHELPADSPMLAALADNLSELPPGVRWLFISRQRAPAAFSRALARQQLRALDADELRLDSDETRHLARLHGRADAVLAALDPAQGWAAGLTLMLLGRADAEHLPAFDALDRLFDFFAGEVLIGMPEVEQQALLRIALLPRVEGAQALALTGFEGAPALLARLAADSVFTQCVVGHVPTYVLHSLFADFLRRRLAQSVDRNEHAGLLRRAATVALQAGDRDTSVMLLAQSGAVDDAVDVLARTAPSDVSCGRINALARLIAALPPSAAARLALWRGFCAADDCPHDALADAERAYADAVASGDTAACCAATALAASVLVAGRRMQELGPWIDRLEADGADPAAAAGGALGSVIVPGLLAALVFHRPWHRWTPVLADHAEALLQHEAARGQQLLLGPLAFHLHWSGELERLDRLIARIDALCQSALASPQALVRWWSVAILVKSMTGHNASAQVDVTRAVALAEVEPALEGQRCAVELLACIVATVRRDVPALRWHLARAAANLQPTNAADRTMLEQQTGVAALLEDDRANALRVMRAAVNSGRSSGFAIRDHIALLSNALAAAHAGELDEATSLLVLVRAHPIYPVCRWHQWFGALVAALVVLRRGDHDAAACELATALGVARRFGYRDAPLLFAAQGVMPALMALALSRGIEPAIATEIVRRHRLAPPPEADECWPWPVRVHAIGGLTVAVDGAPMASTRKESRRLVELLELLAAHGHDAVPIDDIADALWPDADGDAARESLDNAVYRLRKALGGKERVVQRHGALALSVDHCWIDVAAAAQAMHQACASVPEVREGARAALHRLDRGVLLPGNEQLLVAARRRRLQQGFEAAWAMAGASPAGFADPAQSDDAARRSTVSLSGGLH